jgi:alkanesulfonate monooxygenase SsuD/methylene tetrahydromethanopterin reductase-like flavin-dependent oxidoreductase (luciferase family)
MFDEALPEIVKMMGPDEYGPYEGQFFSLPRRQVLPKPVTLPHPPIWVAAGSPGTFEKAARMGIGVLCFSFAGTEALKPLIDIYKTTIEDADPVGGYVNNNVMVTSQLMCLEDGKRAREIASVMGGGYHQTLLWKYLDTFPKPEWVEALGGKVPEMDLATIDYLIENQQICIGTPDEVARSVEAYQAIGADQLVFGMLSSTMPIEVAIEAVETFGKYVIPKFDTDPVHSTTRQREAQAQ